MMDHRDDGRPVLCDGGALGALWLPDETDGW